MHSVKVSHGTGDGGRGKRVVLVHDKASSAEASAEPQQFIEVTIVCTGLNYVVYWGLFYDV